MHYATFLRYQFFFIVLGQINGEVETAYFKKAQTIEQNDNRISQFHIVKVTTGK